MAQKVNQNLGNISTNYVYQANMKYEIDDVVKVFKEDIKKRADLSAGFKNDAANSSVGRNYDVVYYPVYLYHTDTTKSWTTTKTSTSHYSDYKVTTTTKTRNTRGGYKGTSGVYVKKDHEDLQVKNVDLEATGQVSNYKTISVPVYRDGLFYNAEENKKNGIEAGRKAANAGKNDSTYTVYTINTMLVPVFRYTFSAGGSDKNVFEMNLHNGEFTTLYKQSGGGKFFTTLLKILYKFVSFLFIILPLISLFSTSGFGRIIGLIFVTIGGIIATINFVCTSKYQFQKMWSVKGGAVKKLIAFIVVFVIILILSLVLKA